MSRTLHLFGTDWGAMMVPIQVIRWYRMQCYDGTDSCAIVVPIRRYCHLRVVLDIHKAEIADLLKDMCQDGLLVQDGYGRGTKYYLPNGDSNIPSNIVSSDSNITCSGSNIPSNIASSGSKVANLSPNIPSSDSNMPSNIAGSGSKVANLSSNISSPNISISNMESLRKKKKLSFEELKKLICLVCSDWQSLDELALQVNRNKTYLKLIGGIKIRLKISIFYGEKVVHLADF